MPHLISRQCRSLHFPPKSASPFPVQVKSNFGDEAAAAASYTHRSVVEVQRTCTATQSPSAVVACKLTLPPPPPPNAQHLAGPADTTLPPPPLHSSCAPRPPHHPPCAARLPPPHHDARSACDLRLCKLAFFLAETSAAAAAAPFAAAAAPRVAASKRPGEGAAAAECEECAKDAAVTRTASPAQGLELGLCVQVHGEGRGLRPAMEGSRAALVLQGQPSIPLGHTDGKLGAGSRRRESRGRDRTNRGKCCKQNSHWSSQKRNQELLIRRQCRCISFRSHQCLAGRRSHDTHKT